MRITNSSCKKYYEKNFLIRTKFNRAQQQENIKMLLLLTASTKHKGRVQRSFKKIYNFSLHKTGNDRFTTNKITPFLIKKRQKNCFCYMYNAYDICI